MGCYLSKPDDKVFVSEGKGENFVYATASCQGWRREQEDAEECLPFYDDGASLFILCDGHGGSEVARYTVEHLPDFIKNHPLYKEGKYEQALEQAFIEFDATLRIKEVMAELCKLAFDETNKKDHNKESKTLGINENEKNKEEQAEGSSAGPSAGTSSSNNGASSVVEDVDTDTLRREAEVPLNELIEKYSTAKHHNLSPGYNASPVIKAKGGDDGENGEAGVSNSSGQASNEGQSRSEEDPEEGPSGTITRESLKEALIKQVLGHYFNDSSEDSSDDSEYDAGSSNNDDDDGDDEGDDDGGESSGRKLRRKKHKRPTDENIDTSSNEDEDDDDEDDDEDDDDDDDERKEEADDEEDDDDDEEDDDDDDEEDDEEGDDDEDQWIDIQNMVKPESRVHKPGVDSGCTVVVALMRDNKLYVASAGDSRCIVLTRDGGLTPMSFDHKPEDKEERRRIMKAGGRVTEGRVNGGLNLSRALGDFTYKNPELDAKDQMITPCPDVKTIDLSPDETEYIFLACDGIWNSMQNSEVAKFIRELAPTVNGNLIDICLGLFRTCIAPKTDGDGTGCDNMTCILAKFGDSSSENPTNSDLTTTKIELEDANNLSSMSQKRATNEEETIHEMPNNKRRCLRLSIE